jgi:hypothetical protein
MGTYRERTGERHGRLRIIRKIDEGPEFERIRRYSSGAVWLCECDCGVIKGISAENIKRGIRSCGCSTEAINEVGNRYGRLVVQERMIMGEAFERFRKRGGEGALWRCLCDCGEESFVRGAALRYGSSKSCGCWQEDSTSISCSKHGPPILVVEDVMARERIEQGRKRR